MLKVMPLLLPALLSACLVVGPAIAAPDGTLDLEQRAYVASRLYHDCHKYFAHWQGVPELDFEQAYRSYLKEALAAKDRLDFDMASSAFLASLRNGHTAFNDRYLAEQAGGPVGFFAFSQDGKWIVVRSQRPELKPGDEVIAIDGRPMETFFQASKKYVSASSEQGARVDLFYRNYLFPKRFTLTLDGKRTVIIDRNSRLASATAPKTEGRWLEEGRIGYIRVPSFADPQFEQAAIEQVQRFKDAKALVIDVRGNDGGSTPGSLVRALMDRPYMSMSYSTPCEFSMSSAYKSLPDSLIKNLPEQTRGLISGLAAYADTQLYWPSSRNQPAPGAFKGKVYMLMDRQCFSACEDFLAYFKSNGRATLIGETSSGSTGQPFLADMGNGMSYRLSTKRVYMADGSPFEGVGIIPDVPMAVTVAVMLGKDLLLEKALELAQK